MDSKNLGKMGVAYDKPPKALRSGSQGGSASHNTQPSTSGAGDQEVDSHHQAGPSTSRGPRVFAAHRALLREVVDEMVFRLRMLSWLPSEKKLIEASGRYVGGSNA